MQFYHSYKDNLSESFYKAAQPKTFANLETLFVNESLCDAFEISKDALSPEAFKKDPSLGSSFPIATAYAGHQFGHFVPQLGDGRAVLLGEVALPNGDLRDFQLKGSGITPFSRRGDGLYALGPAIRECIVSEAMFALGVSTTRTLALYGTNEQVAREDYLPGGLLIRTAKSHIRIGTFEYFASREDTTSIKQLADLVISRHYPEIQNVDESQKYLELLKEVMDKQIDLIGDWIRVGFVHGVMNTDNMAVAGETIDYGPCAFMEEYHPRTVFSSIDRRGRYSFGNQGPIAQWNLTRLAECLLPLFHAEHDKAVAMAQDAIANFSTKFEQKLNELYARKLGFDYRSLDHTHKERAGSLLQQLLDILEVEKVDYTHAFLLLESELHSKSYSRIAYKPSAAWIEFVSSWKKFLEVTGNRVQDALEKMETSNPKVIPRNHLLERVIRAAYDEGNFDLFYQMLKTTQKPYKIPENNLEFMEKALPKERVYKTFCGT